MAVPPSVAERKKILIVDDELGVRELLAETLRQRGYEVLTAQDGSEGLEQATQTLPNLILLDVMMPKMDGWEMLKRLRRNEKTRDILVIMLTARSETESLMRSEENKTLDYFIKPINLEELIAFIRRYI